MNNAEEFESLCWVEASLKNIKYENNCLSFTMTDLISYKPKPIYEYVEIVIQNIKGLNISLVPFINGEYVKEEYFRIGNLNYPDYLGFEGRIETNPFTDQESDYFWITADFEAANICIKRTGRKLSLD
ncbi:MAG: hypothetical protein AAF383_19530 [Cyanobacteria bacterium P01_A01_bin.83]